MFDSVHSCQVIGKRKIPLKVKLSVGGSSNNDSRRKWFSGGGTKMPRLNASCAQDVMRTMNTFFLSALGLELFGTPKTSHMPTSHLVRLFGWQHNVVGLKGQWNRQLWWRESSVTWMPSQIFGLEACNYIPLCFSNMVLSNLRAFHLMGALPLIFQKTKSHCQLCEPFKSILLTILVVISSEIFLPLFSVLLNCFSLIFMGSSTF